MNALLASLFDWNSSQMLAAKDFTLFWVLYASRVHVSPSDYEDRD